MAKSVKKTSKTTALQKAPRKTAEPSPTAPKVIPERQPDNRTIVATGQFFRGPIPHPEILKRYNDIIPNAADRILAMAEKQQTHREHLERTVVESDGKRANMGLYLGFALCFTLVCGAIYLVAIGRNFEGLATIFTTLGSVVGAFIWAHKSRKNERLERKKMEEKQAEKQLSLPLE